MIDAYHEHRTSGRKLSRLAARTRRGVDTPAERRRNAVEIWGKSLWKSHEQDVDDDVNIFIAGGNRVLWEQPL
jgi:hypothetical protein